jgi:hypothetical protein
MTTKGQSWALAILGLLALSQVAPLVPAAEASGQIGFGVGDVATYEFDAQVITTNVTLTIPPVTYNTSSVSTNQFSLKVTGSDTSGSVGRVGYIETNLVTAGHTLSSPVQTVNTTAIFDPYNNYTYLGRLGFYVFTFSDLRAGNVTNLKVITKVPGPKGNLLTTWHFVNATIDRTASAIGISMVVRTNSTSIPPWHAKMSFSADTGVLSSGTIVFHAFNRYNIFNYTLVDYTLAGPSFLFIVPYLAVAAAAVAIVAFLARRRKPRAQRKEDRMRERFGSS